MKQTEDTFDLLNVIENNYCIGCGVCTAVENSPIKILENDNGQLQAVVENEYIDTEMKYRLDTVCPFSNKSDNEDLISQKKFSDLDGFNKKIGYYDKLYAGYVSTGEFRSIGSSGGFGSWLCTQLLRYDLVDEIIHVKGDEESKFKYSVSKTVEEVKAGAKSRYYPIEMSQVLEYVKNEKKRFAIVGIPCFIKSIRLLSNQNEEIRSKISFTIGLVCGHLKSSYYSDMLAWKIGINPSKKYDINFREKIKGRKASDYSTKVTTKDGDKSETIKPTKEIYGTKWSYGFFKYNACDFCDDVLAETADITIGDAWLDEYLDDYLGTNIIVSRNKVITDIIEKAIDKKEIKIDELSESKIIESQEGGFRHRHNGLSYRLYLNDKKNKWRPNKRHQASKDHLTMSRKIVFKLRMIIRKASFKYYKKAIKQNDISYFDNRMKLLTYTHDIVSKISWKKLVNKSKSILPIVNKD